MRDQAVEGSFKVPPKKHACLVELSGWGIEGRLPSCYTRSYTGPDQGAGCFFFNPNEEEGQAHE